MQTLQPKMAISQQRWVALIINVVGAAEFPGIVNYYAILLSQAGLSILHISTFESEVFLIQENDIEKACDVMRMSENPSAGDIMGKSTIINRNRHLSRENLDIIIDEINYTLSSSSSSSNSISNVNTDDNGDGDYDNNNTCSSNSTRGNSDGSQIHAQVASISSTKKGFILCALPRHVMLARFVNKEAFLQCSGILAKLLLFDARYSYLERSIKDQTINNDVDNHNIVDGDVISSRSSVNDNKDRATYIFGIWKCQDEYTLLLEENDVDLFPQDCLVISPQRWRVIKLCGRPIDFDETGIVSAMSEIDNSIVSLNMSTATTNCTLVPEELLEESLICLSKVLNCPIRKNI